MTFPALLAGGVLSSYLLSTALRVTDQSILTTERLSTLRTTPRKVGMNRGLVSDEVALVGEPLLTDITRKGAKSAWVLAAAGPS